MIIGGMIEHMRCMFMDAYRGSRFALYIYLSLSWYSI